MYANVDSIEFRIFLIFWFLLFRRERTAQIFISFWDNIYAVYRKWLVKHSGILSRCDSINLILGLFCYLFFHECCRFVFYLRAFPPTASHLAFAFAMVYVVCCVGLSSFVPSCKKQYQLSNIKGIINEGALCNVNALERKDHNCFFLQKEASKKILIYHT